MKGNVKKLVVFVIVAALALFIVVATASAGGLHPIRNTIQGKYAATGSSQCTTAVEGFDENLTPNGDYWSVGISTIIAIYTFNVDGSGSMVGINRIMSLPGGFTRINDVDVPNDKPMEAGMKPADFYRSEAYREGRERMNRHLDAVLHVRVAVLRLVDVARDGGEMRAQPWAVWARISNDEEVSVLGAGAERTPEGGVKRVARMNGMPARRPGSSPKRRA